MNRGYHWVLAAVLLGILLVACEQAPGEVSGMVRYADGRTASVLIKILDMNGNVVKAITSASDGTYYTQKVIPPGKYKVVLFSSDGDPLNVEAEITMAADGSVVQNFTI